jgi:hypothetical protein
MVHPGVQSPPASLQDTLRVEATMTTINMESSLRSNFAPIESGHARSRQCPALRGTLLGMAGTLVAGFGGNPTISYASRRAARRLVALAAALAFSTKSGSAQAPPPSPPLQIPSRRVCGELRLDLSTGTVNGLTARNDAREIMATLPCFSGMTATFNGEQVRAVAYQDHGMDFILSSRIIRISNTFPGLLVAPLFKGSTITREQLDTRSYETLSERDGNTYTMRYFARRFGCVIVESDASGVRNFYIAYIACTELFDWFTPPTRARGSPKVCNTGSSDLTYTVTHSTGLIGGFFANSWRSVGWERIRPRGCATVSLGMMRPQQGYFSFYRLRSGSWEPPSYGPTQGADRRNSDEANRILSVSMPLCVQATAVFNYEFSGDLPKPPCASGQESRPFQIWFSINGMANNFTFNISDTGVTWNAEVRR